MAANPDITNAQWDQIRDHSEFFPSMLLHGRPKEEFNLAPAAKHVTPRASGSAAIFQDAGSPRTARPTLTRRMTAAAAAPRPR